MRAALAFLTPLGGARPPDGRTFTWFPAVGALIGGTLGLTWWCAARVWSGPVAAGLVVAADLACTGMLHLDGLADTADGILPHLDRPARLRVMAEPTVGAFALGVVTVVLGLRWAALASLTPDATLLAALWCASRTLMAVGAGAVPYARADGLATALLAEGGARRWRWIGVGGVALSTGLAFAGGHPAATVSVLAALLAGTGVLALAARRLGGFTGDVLGAAGIVAETVGLLVAAARW